MTTAPSAARQLRTAAPRLVEVATRRARLSVVPRRRVRAPRVPFVTLVSVILVGGVVGLLCFNTQMQQAAFTASTLETRADNLSARQQTLEMELEQLRNPNRVAAAAQRAGMVIPDTAGQISLDTGKVTGIAEPATRAATPPLQGRAPAKPASIAPPTQTVVVPPDPAAVAAAAQAADAALAAQQVAQQTAAANAAAKAAKQAQKAAQKQAQNQTQKQAGGAAAGRR